MNNCRELEQLLYNKWHNYLFNTVLYTYYGQDTTDFFKQDIAAQNNDKYSYCLIQEIKQTKK